MHSDYARQGTKIYYAHPEAGVMELIAVAMTPAHAETILTALQASEVNAEVETPISTKGTNRTKLT